MEHYIDFIGQGMTIQALVEALCYEMNITPHPKVGNIPVEKAYNSSTPKFVIETLDLLPQPFEWRPIWKGEVTIEKGGYLDKDTNFTVPAFEMAKYPVTNAQFKLFIDAGGYHEKRWWTDDGWAQCQQENWTQPGSWDNSTGNGAYYPVIGVSWYEAVAFCLWLSETTGENIMLPTEQQWQRAAQDYNKMIYPWGNMWDASRCNNNVGGKGIGRTTPVTEYEGTGDSPFGVTDMSGNVWEWCLTAYETGKTDLQGTDIRVVRGGSWYDNSSDNFRVVYRHSYTPDMSSVLRGFRIVCSR